MKLPRKLRIAGLDWKVTGRKRMEEDARGECIQENLHIRVNTSYPPQTQASSLLHECLHAISWDLPESTVVKLEERLFALFNDNPGLARRLFGRNA